MPRLTRLSFQRRRTQAGAPPATARLVGNLRLPRLRQTSPSRRARAAASTPADDPWLTPGTTSATGRTGSAPIGRNEGVGEEPTTASSPSAAGSAAPVLPCELPHCRSAGPPVRAPHRRSASPCSSWRHRGASSTGVCASRWGGRGRLRGRGLERKERRGWGRVGPSRLRASRRGGLLRRRPLLLPDGGAGASLSRRRLAEARRSEGKRDRKFCHKRSILFLFCT
jgi:hypothetical protein